MKIYYDQDADLNDLKGVKVAIIGYGSPDGSRPSNLLRKSGKSSGA